MQTAAPPFVALTLADLNIEDGVAGSDSVVICIGVPDVPLAHAYQNYLLARRCDADVMVCIYSMADWVVIFPGGMAEFFQSMCTRGHPPVHHAVRVDIDPDLGQIEGYESVSRPL